MQLHEYKAKTKLPSKSTASWKHDSEMDASLNIQPELGASVDTVNTGLLTHLMPMCIMTGDGRALD